MSHKTWMPLYVGDFLADVSGLSSTEVGAYLLLILAYWANGGPLPNDQGQIRRILRHPKRFAEVLARVSQYFTVTDTHYTHQRIDKELNRASIAHAKRVSAGSKAHAKLEQCTTQLQPQPDIVSSSLHSEETITPLKPPKGGVTYTDEFLAFWTKYPHKVGKDAAWRAWQKRRDRPSLQTILSAINSYVASKPADREFCNPATWLNQGRWEDAPATNGANGHDERRKPPPGVDPVEWWANQTEVENGQNEHRKPN